MDARGQRLDVANTINYRRRKGTRRRCWSSRSHDVTGWESRAVEFFRRLARTRHGLDPAIGQPGRRPMTRVRRAALQRLGTASPAR